MDPEIKEYIDVQLAGRMAVVGNQMDLVIATNLDQSKELKKQSIRLDEINSQDSRHWDEMQQTFRIIRADVDQMTKERIEAHAVAKYKKDCAETIDKKRDFWIKVLVAAVGVLSVMVAIFTFLEGHKVATGELQIPKWFQQKIVDSPIPKVYAETIEPPPDNAKSTVRY